MGKDIIREVKSASGAGFFELSASNRYAYTVCVSSATAQVSVAQICDAGIVVGVHIKCSVVRIFSYAVLFCPSTPERAQGTDSTRTAKVSRGRVAKVCV